jgi:tetratricopeptide (TPR) repeat protein
VQICGCLRTLADKSLVRRAGEDRYDLHDLTRQFAAEQLRASGRESEAHRRHAEVYVYLVAGILSGGNVGQGYDRIERELDNCRAVLRRTIDSGHAEVALMFLAALFLPWLRRGHWREGERWCREALDAVGDREGPWACQVLVYLGNFLAVQGRYLEAAPFGERAVAMAERVDDLMAKLAVAEQRLQAEPDLEEAWSWFERFVELVGQWQHPARDARLAGSYFLFGDRLRNAGRYGEAEAHYRRSIELFKGVETDLLAYPLGNLGRLALQAGRLAEAYDLVRESMRISRDSGSRVGIADWSRFLGEVQLHRGDLDSAELAFDEALALYEEIGNMRAATEMHSYLAHTALLQERWNLAIERVRAFLTGYRDRLRDVLDMGGFPSAEMVAPYTNGLLTAAVLLARAAQDEAAALVLGHARSRAALSPYVPEPALQALTDRVAVQTQDRLGAERFAAAEARGQAMVLGEALGYALSVL